MKHIAWHLVSTQLILAVMIIICSCLCNSLGAEMVRKFLTPSLALSKDLSACCQHWASFHIQSTLSLSPQAPYFCAMECPILGTQGIAPRLSLPPFALPDAHFPWESRLLRTTAAAIPACSCCPKTGQHGSAVLPLRTAFFSLILENLVGLCQRWTRCQLPPVCPWCFCLGTLCTQAPAESHTPDCKPVIPSDGFSHHPVLLVPPRVPFSHFSASSLVSLSISPMWWRSHLRRREWCWWWWLWQSTTYWSLIMCQASWYV